jgi:hypothetical protein
MAYAPMAVAPRWAQSKNFAIALFLTLVFFLPLFIFKSNEEGT